MSVQTTPPPSAPADEPGTPEAPSGVRPPNPRARRRRQLYLIGLLPLLLALAFTVKVSVMRHHDAAGIAAFDDGDGATALEQFSANQSLNWFEPWIAHFDAGNASFRLTDYDRAIDLYHRALETVPHAEECTVRINLGLSHEKVGDLAAEGGDLEGARNAWEDGITMLTDGDCPTDAGGGKDQTEDAKTVKERLEQKLTPQQSPSNGKGGQGKNDKNNKKNDENGQNQTPQEREQERKRDQLERRNGQGEQERREYEDLDDYDDFGYEYQW